MEKIKEQYEAFLHEWQPYSDEIDESCKDENERFEQMTQELMRAVAEKQREKDANRAWSYGVENFMQGIGVRHAVENELLITDQLNQLK